ncbi:MAG: hypothetical protein JW699_02785 [Chitinispirillaceae bacterium]|nr:hypothetical protein [Chitinispirillaceae bacterium]
MSPMQFLVQMLPLVVFIIVVALFNNVLICPIIRTDTIPVPLEHRKPR